MDRSNGSGIRYHIKNICLIGYMGSGKTTVGRLVAGKLAMELKDTDELITMKEGRSISDIFSNDGEAYFRELENRLLNELAKEGKLKDTVLSTGGGLPVDVRNRPLLKRIGTVIYLKASAASLNERVGDDTGRPLLDADDRLSRIEDMLKIRGPIYEECADHIIETDSLSIEETVTEVVRIVTSWQDKSKSS